MTSRHGRRIRASRTAPAIEQSTARPCRRSAARPPARRRAGPGRARRRRRTRRSRPGGRARPARPCGSSRSPNASASRTTCPTTGAADPTIPAALAARPDSTYSGTPSRLGWRSACIRWAPKTTSQPRYSPTGSASQTSARSRVSRRWRPVRGQEGQGHAGGGQRDREQDRGDGRPARRDDHGRHPRRRRPDRGGLERPQDVVATRAEDEHDRHRPERPPLARLAPDHDEDDPGDHEVEREGDRQVRPVRDGPDRPDQQPVEHDERRAQVLVVRREDALDGQVAQEQERVLVVVEGHVPAEPDEDRDRRHGQQDRRPRDVGPASTGRSRGRERGGGGGSGGRLCHGARSVRRHPGTARIALVSTLMPQLPAGRPPATDAAVPGRRSGAGSGWTDVP